jgi:hypothetical protein
VARGKQRAKMEPDDNWRSPSIAPATGTLYFLRCKGTVLAGDLAGPAPPFEPVLSINDVLAACVNGPQTHRIDNVHYGPIDIRVRQPYEREVSVHFELEPSHPVRRFLLFAEAKVWRVEEVDITSFAKHERSCLLQFHALCGPAGIAAIVTAGARLHFVRRQSKFGQDLWASLVIHGAFVDTIQEGSLHMVSVPANATVTFSLVGSHQLRNSFSFVPFRTHSRPVQCTKRIDFKSILSRCNLFTLRYQCSREPARAASGQ